MVLSGDLFNLKSVLICETLAQLLASIPIKSS
jgi:hypothetical protein